MARPNDPAKRRDIARRAIEVLKREGMDISSTRLAQEIGIKRPTLLYHFPERISIIEMALANVLGEQAQFVVGRMMTHSHPIDQLYEQVRSVHAFHDGREERLLFLTQALAAAGSHRVSNIIAIGNQAFEAHRQALTKRLEAGIEQGIVRPCDCGSLIRICRAMIDGLMVQRVMTGCELAPIHQLLWESVLAPLKIDPQGDSDRDDNDAPKP